MVRSDAEGLRLKSKTPPLVVFVDTHYQKPEGGYGKMWAYHDGEKILFNRLDEARTKAAAIGYDGIIIEHRMFSPERSVPLPANRRRRNNVR